MYFPFLRGPFCIFLQILTLKLLNIWKCTTSKGRWVLPVAYFSEVTIKIEKKLNFESEFGSIIY